MPIQHLTPRRLHHQQISQTAFTDAAALAGWFGAMQAQEYPSSRWALGLRLPDSTDAAISAAIDAGKIIRTHILRPTWHLVAADDIRWMLELSGPRVKAQIAGSSQRLGLTPAILKKSHAVVEQALQGGRHLTRTELIAELEQTGLKADALQAAHIMMHAELDGLICSGAMRGKQFTYALLDDRVPKTRPLQREEAVATLLRRYLQSHGPATLPDFVWWSGLTLSDAKAGLEVIKGDFTSQTIDQHTYWMPANTQVPEQPETAVHFLPGFDEYLVAYKNRDACLDPAFKNTVISSNGIFKPVLVVNGKVVGVWQRTMKKDKVLVELNLFSSLSPEWESLIRVKAEQYGRFLGMPLIFEVSPSTQEKVTSQKLKFR